MFTGIITDIGTVARRERRDWGLRLRIACRYDPDELALGASVACSGPCLTVVEKGRENGRAYFDVEASRETLEKTTIGEWTEGKRLNLERALRVGDELGGHIVTGHIDAVAEIVERAGEGETVRFTYRVPAAYARYIAPKGSISLDGTSLTVNEANENTFTTMLIPHTLASTVWGDARAGDRINLEVDLFARYLARLGQFQPNGTTGT